MLIREGENCENPCCKGVNMIINHNLSAVNANRYVKFRDWDIQKSMAKLASGQRINTAADDATGLAVSEKMRTQINGLRQAERNAEDAISFVQTAEGFLTQTTELVQRIRELSIQSANGIYSRSDRQLIQVEVSQLIDEIDRIASQAEYNKMSILTGEFAKTGAKASMWFHMGPNMNQTERVYIGTMTAGALGLKKEGTAEPQSLSSPSLANEMIGKADEALTKILKQRADLGAYGNRLENTAKGLMNAYENVQASESRIRDVDMAEEFVNYVRHSILMETGSIILAHANLRPQTVLKLLSG
jgi:flagellin